MSDRRRPVRFSVVPTWALAASREDALSVLHETLGLPVLDEDDAHLAFGFGQHAVYVDVSGSMPARGFLPSFAVDDLEAGIAHLTERGCAVAPLPWDAHAPGRLVTGPGGICFCLVGQRDIERLRAAPGPTGLLADDDADPGL